jgi:hypothetical protein
MKTKTQERRSLAKGQVWKTRAANIEIVGLGKSLIHYKITRQFGLRQVSAQISGIQAMANYLEAHQARLVKGPSAN